MNETEWEWQWRWQWDMDKSLIAKMWMGKIEIKNSKEIKKKPFIGLRSTLFSLRLDHPTQKLL